MSLQVTPLAAFELPGAFSFQASSPDWEPLPAGDLPLPVCSKTLLGNLRLLAATLGLIGGAVLLFPVVENPHALQITVVRHSIRYDYPDPPALKIDAEGSLYTLRDGTLVSLHGSYAPGHGGLRLIFSSDGGQTWIAPANDHGFLVDRCYGYGKAFELPDGWLLVACQDTGGHATADAKQMSLRLLRLRIRADHSGIDLLPASPPQK